MFSPYEMRNVLTDVHLNRRHDGYLGDMPKAWIGSEYVRAIYRIWNADDVGATGSPRGCE